MIERRPRLEGKVAIVTGAGSSGVGIGNGKAASILFAGRGAKVLLVTSSRTGPKKPGASLKKRVARPLSSREI